MMEPGRLSAVLLELNAVIVAVEAGSPSILTTDGFSLPCGPFETNHRTLEQGLRAWAKMKAHKTLGYIEQLYTFADRGRRSADARAVSIGYLALVRESSGPQKSPWSPWYKHFPWEDHRLGPPPLIAETILPALNAWKNKAASTAQKKERATRIQGTFPSDPRSWNEELVLQRYELLWEVGLVAEAPRPKKLCLGEAMAYDHRRIVATAMARLRAKIKYRPVVFELLPKEFTMLDLQNTVEALAGTPLHKQNFRRLIERQGLVEETGRIKEGTSGRPAKLFSFRKNVLQERVLAGTKTSRTF
ncbi:MAG: hypothetical protein PHS57_05550 [Alphaproteobacteria bacterium]|nr:hypothetical protein [Alphaproteobacteria bacterium]